MPDRSVALVTFTDDGYFPLMEEMVRSFRRFPGAADVDVCVFHVGLSEERRARLPDLVERHVEPDWPEDRDFLRGQPDRRKAFAVPPFIPEIFPGYDVYLWIDADCWVADWEGVALAIDTAREDGALAIAATVDRAYGDGAPGVKLRWIADRPAPPKMWMYKHARHILSPAEARAIAHKPILNTGVWALPAGAPHWAAWAGYARRFWDARAIVGDQIALNLAIWRDGPAVRILPAACNWLMAQALPMWDPDVRRLLEPQPPYRPISVAHLTEFKAERLDRSLTLAFPVKGGGVYHRTPRYDPDLDTPDFDS
ncbi:MAG: hypothetical protein RID91_13490 [Azospirillaceae bacterium]